MYGKNISLQFFEVEGNPVLNQNGSDSTKKAFHGFPHDRKNKDIPHDRDDYLSGEKYTSIAVVRGYLFPEKSDFGFNHEDIVPPNSIAIKGKFLEFIIPGETKILLQPGKKYAFLIMIDSVGSGRGFTLANNYSGSYNEGNAIRREGKGVFPPIPADIHKSIKDPENLNSVLSANFPDQFEERLKITPGTNGYPDVDTWRDLVFYIRAK